MSGLFWALVCPQGPPPPLPSEPSYVPGPKLGPSEVRSSPENRSQCLDPLASCVFGVRSSAAVVAPSSSPHPIWAANRSRCLRINYRISRISVCYSHLIDPFCVLLSEGKYLKPLVGALPHARMKLRGGELLHDKLLARQKILVLSR